MQTSFKFNDPVHFSKADPETRKALLERPAMADNASVSQKVASIIAQVRATGDLALKELGLQFDQIAIERFAIDKEHLQKAGDALSSELKIAMQQAKENISCFHKAQIPIPIQVETMPGVVCEQVTRPIEAVGLYIPGGSAPLFSTVLMLAVPAKLAGCQRLILCSPPPIANEILYAAALCGVDEVFQIGGAQAVAAMAFGTESIPKVDKIFGPGNRFVTEAKRQVSQAIGGAAIDMPAGPSEVLVIADHRANPEFIAADLLSQAEHGPDSQVLLLTESTQLAEQVIDAVANQLMQLPRQSIATEALTHSRIIITKSVADSIEISNQYGPEHLIIQVESAERYVDSITHAGSVFVGDYSPESAGDYASGTNHVLPTYGYTKTYSSLGLADFQKRMTVQRLSQSGLALLGPTIEVMAEAERLMAHKQAVSIRLATLNKMNP